MDTASLRGKILHAGEEGITRVVDRILSRNYLTPDRMRGRVQAVIEALDLPTRDETDLLLARVDEMQKKIEQLSARLEDKGGDPVTAA